MTAAHPLDHRIPPPVLFTLVGISMWTLSRLGPAYPLDSTLRFAAAVFGFLAMAVAGSGILAFRNAGTTINPVRIDQASNLVTRGIYNYTRNPMYVGLAGALLAWALFLAAPAAFLGPMVFVLFIDRFQIVPEERAMSAKFSGAYEEYRRRVRRWL